MIMYRVQSQTKDGYPSSHGYYETKEEARVCITELADDYSNRKTKYWIITVR